MLINKVKFSSLVAVALADITKDTDHAFGCVSFNGEQVLLQAEAYLLIDTTGYCNEKPFSVLCGRSEGSHKLQLHIFSQHTISENEQASIRNKITRCFKRHTYKLDNSISHEFFEHRIQKRLFELDQQYKLGQIISMPMVQEEVFYLLHVSAFNIEKAKQLGAVQNKQLKRFMIGAKHPNLKNALIEQWLPTNNPMYILDNPKHLMRRSQWFKDNGASAIRNISKNGKVKMVEWVVFADQPNIDDFWIYIANDEFRTYLNVSKHDYKTVKSLGALWDNQCHKFYTSNSDGNSIKFRKWLPETNPELLVYIRDYYLPKLRKYELFPVKGGQYSRVYIDNPDLQTILYHQDISIKERETLKKELIMLHVGKDDFDIVRRLGAVQCRVMRRLEWFISTDHENYSELSQWLTSNNPKVYLEESSLDEYKRLGAFYDIHQKQWFLYAKDHQTHCINVKAA